ncbi:MAG TPA: hypothetical protein VGD52_26265 [Pseudoduganella sp.]
MRFNSTFWFQGWQIILRCAVFSCNDGVKKFASTAILRYMPPSTDCTSLHRPAKIRRSIVFPETAFRTREAANADAIAEAQRQIIKLNGGARIDVA